MSEFLVHSVPHHVKRRGPAAVPDVARTGERAGTFRPPLSLLVSPHSLEQLAWNGFSLGRYGVLAALFRRVALGGVLLALVPAAWGAPPPKFLPPGWRAELYEGRSDIIRFVSPDSRADLTMGDMPASGRGFRSFADRPGEHVTYRARKGSWVVVSGYRGGRIFYRRADLACGGKRWHVIEVTYSRADKRRLDAVVTRISHSLGSYGEDCPGQQ